MLYISGINYESIADAEGVVCTIFISGCRHFCEGCHSKDTWNFKNGKPLTDELIHQMNNEIRKRPFLSGIALSGGDPMYSPIEVHKMLSKLVIPKNNVWCYTGFLFDEIQNDDDKKVLLNDCNVVIDGKFDLQKRDVSLNFRGSSNQRIWRKNIFGIWTQDKEELA